MFRVARALLCCLAVSCAPRPIPDLADENAAYLLVEVERLSSNPTDAWALFSVPAPVHTLAFASADGARVEFRGRKDGFYLASLPAGRYRLRCIETDVETGCWETGEMIHVVPGCVNYAGVLLVQVHRRTDGRPDDLLYRFYMSELSIRRAMDESATRLPGLPFTVAPPGGTTTRVLEPSAP